MWSVDMAKSNEMGYRGKMIHIPLERGVHRALAIIAVKEGTTIHILVEGMINAKRGESCK
jgi:hypothetical protein